VDVEGLNLLMVTVAGVCDFRTSSSRECQVDETPGQGEKDKSSETKEKDHGGLLLPLMEKKRRSKTPMRPFPVMDKGNQRKPKIRQQ
jgi:hypothetical protein